MWIVKYLSRTAHVAYYVKIGTLYALFSCLYARINAVEGAKELTLC